MRGAYTWMEVYLNVSSASPCARTRHSAQVEGAFGYKRFALWGRQLNSVARALDSP